MAASKNKKTVAKKANLKTAPKKPTLADQMAPYIIGFIAIFMIACFLMKDYVGFAKYIGIFLCGLFSWGAYSIPVFLIYLAVFYNTNFKYNVHRQKWVFMGISVIFISVVCSLFAPVQGDNLAEHYTQGMDLRGGGVVGGYVYNILEMFIGPVGVGILAVIGLLIFVTLIFGKTPAYIFSKVIKGIKSFFSYFFDTLR